MVGRRGGIWKPKKTVEIGRSWKDETINLYLPTLSGDAPNYFPNSFNGPKDNPAVACSKHSVRTLQFDPKV